jgi:hypothetical protein
VYEYLLSSMSNLDVLAFRCRPLWIKSIGVGSRDIVNQFVGSYYQEIFFLHSCWKTPSCMYPASVRLLESLSRIARSQRQYTQPRTRQTELQSIPFQFNPIQRYDTYIHPSIHPSIRTYLHVYNQHSARVPVLETTRTKATSANPIPTPTDDASESFQDFFPVDARHAGPLQEALLSLLQRVGHACQDRVSNAFGLCAPGLERVDVVRKVVDFELEGRGEGGEAVLDRGR